MIEIKRYTPDMAVQWNSFVALAKNATFMHRRDYIEYHASRFSDFSLLAFKAGRIVAVLPANRVADTIYSHQGLTFGGWLMHVKHADVSTTLAIFDAMIDFLRIYGISHLIYKPSPYIYHAYPADEDLYAIFRHKGSIIASNISASIPLECPFRFNENARRAMNVAVKAGISVNESSDFPHFWNILSDVLKRRHNTAPVHSLDEICLLHSRFPSNIRLFTASSDDRIIAGVVIFDSGIVAHAQYIAACDEACQVGALPLLFHHLIHSYFADRRYFDFGISNENNGWFLNDGLSRQKTGMGGRGISYNSFKLDF